VTASRPPTGSRSLTPDDYRRARRHLVRADQVLAAVVRQVGPCRLADRQREDHLSALIGAVVSQQLSTKAAATIFGRVLDLFPDRRIPGVRDVAAVGDETWRAVGLSRQKTGYLRDLCAQVGDGRLQLDALDELPDDEVVRRLTAVKGFGRWSAEMFLMFRLHRPDVLPVGDLGIINAVQRLYRLRTRPDPRRLTQIGEPWRPYRSVASWYLWQSLRLDVLQPRRTSARR